MRRLAVLLAFGLLLFSYEYLVIKEPVLVDMRSTGLVIYNNTTDSVYFALLETRASAKSFWKPCWTPAVCNYRGILPAKSGRIDYNQIYGWYPGARVNLYWWHLVQSNERPSEYIMDGPHSRTLNTPHIATRAHFQAMLQAGN